MKSSAYILAFLIGACGLGAGYQFPSDGTSKSPNAKWSIVCKSTIDDPESSHRLILMGADRSSRELRRFDRSCDVLWSADSAHVAITDWLGSNLSDIFVYAITNSQSGTSLRDLFPTGAIPDSEIRGHCYFEATKWLDSQRLRIRVFGHTDQTSSHEFDYAYVFDISSQRFEKLTAKTPNKSLQATATAPSVLTGP